MCWRHREQARSHRDQHESEYNKPGQVPGLLYFKDAYLAAAATAMSCRALRLFLIR